MNKIAFIILLVLFLAPVAFAVCAGDSDQLIMRISSTTNAHAELYNGTGNYPVEICYDAIFGQAYTGANPHTGNTILKASGTTNAHVEQSDFSNYSTLIRYGDLSCTFGASCNSAADEVCIATISGTTNAHIATCTGSPYALKVCCSSIEASNAVPVAIAGLPQDVFSSVSVQLDGSGSYDNDDCPLPGGDSDGTCLNYSWSCAASSIDPCPVLSNSLNFKPAFTSGNVGEIYTFQLIVNDGAVDSLADTVTITVVMPANTPPVADAGPAYNIFLPDRSIPLDGSGSTDAEDCIPGLDCYALDYAWTFPFNAADCSITNSSNKIRPVITCNGNVGDTSTVKLVVTDSGNLDNVDLSTATIQILAPEEGPYLKIVLFNAEPLGFSLAQTSPQFTQLNVAIKNFGGDSTDSQIVLEVRDSVTNQPLAVPISDSYNCGAIATGATCTASLAIINNLDISSLPAGSYKLVVEARDSGTVYDTKSLFFIITGAAAVPELSVFLIPLLAFSALAILFFSGKRKG